MFLFNKKNRIRLINSIQLQNMTWVIYFIIIIINVSIWINLRIFQIILWALKLIIM
jgi:hypothetical protein